MGLWYDYGIFNYMKTIKINHENVGKYTVRPMDGMGYIYMYLEP